jgi:TetR/AcrR family transcriptional repressor of nem operon
MGRTKQYERPELLDRAVELFRRRGFHGTTTADLVAELGVNRRSMYAEFGSKQGLFEAVLEHYDRNHLSRVLAPLEAPDAGAEAIRRAFAGYAAASESRFRGLGCLMCNTAVERGTLDPGSLPYVDAYLQRLEDAFRGALANAVESEEIDSTTDVDRLAAFFTMALIGVAALVRAEAPPSRVRAACDVATSLLDPVI